MDLPAELLAAIFVEYTLTNESLTTLRRVCKKWNHVVTHTPALWRHMHLCVDSIPESRRNGSVPFPSTRDILQTIWDRTGPIKALKVVLVLGDIPQPVVLPDPSLFLPTTPEPTNEDTTLAEPTDEDTTPAEPMDEDTAPADPIDEDTTPAEPTDEDTTPAEPTDEDISIAERRAELFEGLCSLKNSIQQRPTDRIRSLRVEINPSMTRRLIEVSLGKLFDPKKHLPMMPVLERLKISITPHHTVPQICAALSFLFHALNGQAPRLRTLCVERVPLGLLTRILSPFPFYGPHHNVLAKRLSRISIKNTFENLDISTFALAEALEELSFSGTLAYNSSIEPATTSVALLPGTDANRDDIINFMWQTFYPELTSQPDFSPPVGNLPSVSIPNLRRLCVGTMSMLTLEKLRLPMLEELTIMRMEQYEESPIPPRHSILLTPLKKLVIGTYRHGVNSIRAPNLECFEIGIPDITSGIIDRESDWCTQCNISNDGTFARNCEDGIRSNARPSPPPDLPLLNRIFDGHEAMLRPHSLRISGPVHEHVLVTALHHLPNLLSLTLNYRVAIGDVFWHRMAPNDTARILCPKLKHLTLDLCTMPSNHAESDNLRGRLSEMIAARNGHTDIPSFESVSVRWKAPESGVASAIGSPMGHDDGAQFVIENITT
ncbi:hypothetical protein CPB86DRAFT_793159 [Serendipita vermifera]|nr:hypothetical protein CPB86DRAFT_793159 [Serendipita vermifera]